MLNVKDLRTIKCLYGIVIILMLLNLVGVWCYGATPINCISAWLCAMIWATDNYMIWTDYYKLALYMQNQFIKRDKRT